MISNFVKIDHAETLKM